MKEGHIWIDEQITNDTYERVKSQLAQNADKDLLTLHIASPGGSVYAGYKIYHALKQSGKTINTIIEGEAQSMATYIALAGKKISICNPSVFMIHNPHSGVEGTAEQMIQGANELIKIEDEMAKAYAERTGIQVDKIKEMMAKTTVLKAQEAKDLGFADEIVGEHYLKAVALGKSTKTMEKKEGKIAKVINALAELINPNSPAAMDYKTKDGKVLSVSEDGKTATIDGQPANGSYVLEDGRTVMCTNGQVTGIQEASQASTQTPPPAPPAPAPAPAPSQTAEQKLAALEEELNKIKAEKKAAEEAKAKAEQEKITAEAEKVKTVQALAQIKKELEEPVGDQEPPSKGMKPYLEPVAIGKKTDPTALGKMASRTFIADNMPWLERYYKDGKYDDGTSFSSYRTNGPNAVSILETNFDYTWNGILTTDIFFKPALNVPAIADWLTVDLGASDKKVYNLSTPIDKVLKPYTGCGGTPAGNRQLITNTRIQLKPFQMYESWCKDDFTGQLSGQYNILAQEWLKTGLSSFDPAGTPINTIIMDALKYGLKKDVFRRVYFGDATSSDADYNQIDGFWQRNIDSSGASNYCVYRYGSALGTGALAANTAKDYFKGIYNNSNMLLKEFGIDTGRVEFQVTRSIWENYYDSLVSTGNVSEAEYENYQKGIKMLTFRGIPVRPMNLWDSMLAESDNPLTATTRHLIAFTLKENHILGVENNADLEKIESWYEMKDQKRYYRSNMILGYQYLHCDLTTISY